MKNNLLTFRLEKLELIDENIFKEKIIFDFCSSSPENNLKNEFDSYQQPFSTLIIGQNGTGKSRLLATIANIFIEIDSIKQIELAEKSEKKERVYLYSGGFDITYSIYGNQNRITNIDSDKEINHKTKFHKEQIKYYKNGKPVSVKEIDFPKKTIASSIMLTDRFRLFKDEREDYKYLGIRNSSSPGTAGTRTYVKKTVDHILEALKEQNTEFIYKIKQILEFLEFQPRFYIYYTPRYKKYFFTGDLNSDKFKQLFENFNDDKLGFTRRVDNPNYIPYNVKYYKDHIKGKKDLIQEIVSFLNEIRKAGRLQSFKKSKTEFLDYDILGSNLFMDEFELIKHLHALDLISYPSISIIKKGDDIDLPEVSSGEYHFIASMIGLTASIRQNSLILIDEPEISLHPNWQMKFMDFINKAFSDFHSCHFIIATHSHFLISDLPAISSGIIGLKIEEKTIKTVSLPKNTFGWSAEDVLYNVFDVATSRNLYVAKEIGEVLKSIAKKEIDFLTIKSKKENLENIKNNLKDGDPLKSLIVKIQKEFINE